MKLLYTSDLHGHEDHYSRLLKAAEDQRPDLVVLGGDLLPDDSALEPETMGRNQPTFVREKFRQIMTELRRASKASDVLVIFGNHDWSSSVTAMQELVEDGVVQILEPTKSYERQGVTFLGYSYTPPTPWYVKDFERLDCRGDKPPLLGGARWDPRFSRVATHGSTILFQNMPTIADDLDQLAAPKGPWVFVCHAPPYDTALDQSYGNGSIGSRSVKEAIARLQPLLSLHGHIHESPTVSGRHKHEIGKSLSVNVGQKAGELQYAAIEIDPALSKIVSVDHRSWM